MFRSHLSSFLEVLHGDFQIFLVTPCIFGMWSKLSTEALIFQFHGNNYPNRGIPGASKKSIQS